MTDGQALLRAVLEAPEDDAPRLIYADWLDGVDRAVPPPTEPERAEFIRVEVELSQIDARYDHVLRRMASAEDSKRSWELVRRRRELLQHQRNPKTSAANADVFAGRIPAFPMYGEGIDSDQPQTVFVNEGRFHFRLDRGFIDSLTCTATDWLAHASAIVAAHPVREVRLTTWPEDLPHFKDGEVGRVVLALEDGRILAEWMFNLRRGPAQLSRPTIVGGLSTRDTTLAAFRGRWPGITFHLPEPGPWYQGPDELYAFSGSPDDMVDPYTPALTQTPPPATPLHPPTPTPSSADDAIQ